MEITKFSEHPRGTVLKLLSDAYAEDNRIVDRYKESWAEFDDFVYSNLTILDQYGFISTVDRKAIGLVSWDPRNRPDYVEVGHNCIIPEYKHQGYGKMQMKIAVGKIRLLEPNKIIVRTGTTPFFLPARKMYESAGFSRVFLQDNPNVPEVVEYCISLQ